MNTILITGANRGIGLGLTEAFLNDDWQVIASYRSDKGGLTGLQASFKNKLFIAKCDVANDESVVDFFKEVSEQFDSLDILVNNAGILPNGERSIVKVTANDLLQTLNVNTVGPLRIINASLPMVRNGALKKIINFSTIMSSYELNKTGGSYTYRISKTALNMLNFNLAIELKPEGIMALAIHPGWVQTDMGGEKAPVTIEESITGLKKIFLQSSVDTHTGKLIDYTGKELPW
ncbi:MAG TPA: SDR family oxidoreductase [Patescibacteria group bacterium]|nr:SDR family oxidoreductase [Patescibacteria group bacterium]